jgi:glycosyltransferase involved in cell wall biosynthesis
MRIIYHHRTRGEDAQGIHIQALQDAWRQLGHEVFEVGLGRPTNGHARPGGGAHSEGRGPLGSLLYEGLSLGYNLYGASHLGRAIKQHHPSFIYERYSLNLCAGAMTARRFRVPFVLEVNAPLVEEMAKESGLMGRGVARRVERLVLRSATKVVVVTDALRRHFAAEGVDTSHFQVIHNGVDPALFHPGVDARPVRGRYGLGDRTVIGFVGWARQWHRLDLLLDAFAALPARERFAVLIAGDGPALPSLKARAQALGVAPLVHFAGAVRHADIPAHIAAMDIAVLPSIPPYASPMKLFEYLAMGKAVVVPDQPNLREVIREGANGMFIPPDAGTALGGFGRAVTALATNPELRLKLSRGAVETIARGGHYWTENARRVLEGLELERLETNGVSNLKLQI